MKHLLNWPLFKMLQDWINQLNPLSTPTLDQRTKEMLGKTKSNLIKANIASIELKFTIDAKRKILNELNKYKNNIEQDILLRAQSRHLDKHINDLELELFDLEDQYAYACCFSDLNKIRIKKARKTKVSNPTDQPTCES